MHFVARAFRRTWQNSTISIVISATCLIAGLSIIYLTETDSKAVSVPPPTVRETNDSPETYTSKLIENIESGDLVVARDPNTGEVTHKRVLQAFRRTSDHLRILEIESATGEKQRIETTDEHPFWVTGRGFVNAGELQAGDRLDDAGGPNGASVVSSIREEHPDGIEVCNFEVEDFHTYFVRAGGTRGPPVFVHNAKCEAVGGGHLRSAKTIKFSQDSIGRRFKDRRSVADTTEMLRRNPTSAATIEPILIVKFDALPAQIQRRLLKQGANQFDVFALTGNRRLAAARRAGTQINTRFATQVELDSFNLSRRFSTKTAGRGIPPFAD